MKAADVGIVSEPQTVGAVAELEGSCGGRTPAAACGPPVSRYIKPLVLRNHMTKHLVRAAFQPCS